MPSPSGGRPTARYSGACTKNPPLGMPGTVSDRITLPMPKMTRLAPLKSTPYSCDTSTAPNGHVIGEFSLKIDAHNGSTKPATDDGSPNFSCASVSSTGSAAREDRDV